ncbi:hypothetical protein SAZ_29565 [Streptomyces noursei ZPM]|nr:hypothetical protein SAZ_29565 [Streptomyces noursei ZPM]
MRRSGCGELMIAVLRRASRISSTSFGIRSLLAPLHASWAGARFHSRSRSGPGQGRTVPYRVISARGKTWSTWTGAPGTITSSQIRQRWCWNPMTAGVRWAMGRRRLRSVR